MLIETNETRNESSELNLQWVEKKTLESVPAIWNLEREREIWNTPAHVIWNQGNNICIPKFWKFDNKNLGCKFILNRSGRDHVSRQFGMAIYVALLFWPNPKWVHKIRDIGLNDSKGVLSFNK